MLCLSWTGIKAQSVTISTEYDEPYKNIWNGALYTGIDLQSNSGGLFLGLYGRFTLAKIATFSVNYAYDYTQLFGSGSLVSFDEELLSQLPSYSNFEARAVFHLIDKTGSMSHKVKLGRGSDGNGNTIKYSTTFASDSRVVIGLTASLNIHSRLAGQQDSNQVFTIKDAQGDDPGYLDNLAGGQKNLVIGFGLHTGQYTWFKGSFSSIKGTKNRRIRKSLVANFEILFAATIATGDSAYYKKDANSALEKYELTDVEKRRLGFRISTDYAKNKPGFYQRMEIGYRPGIWAPSRQSKLLNQGYVIYAIGLGF
jgi:hypothetical protein